jgi:hypothetical protein
MSDAATDSDVRPRYYRFRANKSAGLEKDGSPGGFTGLCTVWEGDEFFMVVGPVKRLMPDGTVKLLPRRMPTWADPIAEYEMPKAPEPIRQIEPGQGSIAPLPAPPPKAHRVIPETEPPKAPPALYSPPVNTGVADRMAKVRAARKPKAATVEV